MLRPSMNGIGHIAVLGAGNMGTALAWLLARNGHSVKLWDFFPQVVEEINRERSNSRYLQGIQLPQQIQGVTAANECVREAELIIVAMPSPFIANTLMQVLPFISAQAAVLNVAKGLDAESQEPIHNKLNELLTGRALAVLAGPAIANEFARGLPTGVVVASAQLQTAMRLQAVLQNEFFRVSVTHDVAGAALGGILKNIYAILLGYLDAVGGGGRNLEATALNASVREMAKLALAKGAQTETIYGLAGLGDLVATGFSEDSHNRNYGRELGRGLSPAELAVKIPLAPEGTRAVVAARNWAAKAGLEVPLADAVYEIIRGKNPSLAELLKHF